MENIKEIASKIKFLRVNNFLGIDELELEPGKITKFVGPKGAGKTSVIEAIEKGVLNKNRRTEIIRHGETEATIFIETDGGLQIDRRIRSDKSDYLKLRQNEKGIKTSEKFLRDLVRGDIFRPLDWINLSVKEQTKSILSMLEIGWTKEDIINWFGELPENINLDQHILLVLKEIEQKYYNTREEVNREVRELKVRIKDIMDELPPEYNGNEWKDKNVQEYYGKVTQAQNINKLITEAKALQDSFQSKVDSIKANAESKKSSITLKYKSEAEDIKDLIALSNNKINKAQSTIDNADKELNLELGNITNNYVKKKNSEDSAYNDQVKQLKEEYELKLQSLKDTHESTLASLKVNEERDITKAKKDSEQSKEESKEIISLQKQKISAKETELAGLSDKETLEKESVDKEAAAEIEKVKVTLGNASKYLEEHEEIDITPLQESADHVQEMVSYLRDWDRIEEITKNQLEPKQQLSADLTAKIDTARTLPQKLILTADMPIDGVSVDAEGRIRIKGTLIDGLSDGEKLELAMKVAKAQCGPLKIICIDKWESLDKTSQDVLEVLMKEDEYQYFVTEVQDTKNGKVNIEKIGEVE